MEQYCTHCKEPVKENAEFCLSCGKVVDAYSAPAKINYSLISKTTLMILVLLVVNFVLTIAIRIIVGNMTNTIQGFFRTTIVTAAITLVIAITIVITAFFELKKQRLTKEVFLIALAISGFFIIQSFLTIIRFIVYTNFSF